MEHLTSCFQLFRSGGVCPLVLLEFRFQLQGVFRPSLIRLVSLAYLSIVFHGVRTTVVVIIVIMVIIIIIVIVILLKEFTSMYFLSPH